FLTLAPTPRSTLFPYTTLFRSDENIQLLAAMQAKQISLINNVRDETIAFADSNTINLVFRNLITNAIKFTNDGGTVIIDARDERSEEHTSELQSRENLVCRLLH